MRYVKYTIRELMEIEEAMFVGALFKHTENREISEATADDDKKIESWKDCLSFLKKQFGKTDLSLISQVSIAFEYQIFDGTWVDAVIVCKDKLIILEFKSGADCRECTLDSHRAQVIGYLNKITHCNRVIWEERKRNPNFVVEKYLIYTNPAMQGKVALLDYIKVTDAFSDVVAAITGPVKEERVAEFLEFTEELDITTIGVIRDILSGHVLSKMYVQDDNVKACADIVDEIQKQQGRQTLNLIFIKGNPGTGKTGTGFSLLERFIDQGAKYVTGNGNLTKIFSRMISKDSIRGVEGAAVGSLHDLYNVPAFCQKFFNGNNKNIKGDVCNSKILIIDEAQRVWNPIQIALAKKNKLGLKHKAFIISNEVSEPLLVLRAILNSMMKDNTSRIVVFLLGTGQEIYIGEENGEQYIRKAVEYVHNLISRMGKDTCVNVYVPTDKMRDEYANYASECKINPGLLLKDNKRSEHNNNALKFVNDFIDTGKAQAESIEDAFYLFNDHSELYNAVKLVNNGSFTVGFLGCSFDPEIKRDTGRYLCLGDNKIHNITNLELLGFYNDKECNALNHFASQFDCQGLELDYSVVIWGKSMLWRNSRWELSKSTIWSVDNYYNQLEKLKTTHPELSGISIDKELIREMFIKNSYRVLLTRARIATYVYIEDRETYEHFRKCYKARG